MSSIQPIKVGLLKISELEEADRILRVAFGTFLGMPNPLDFMGDRDFMASRWRAGHVKAIAAREGGRLIGSNVVTRWGSFGFFGPLTVLPEYWDRGVAQRLLEATMTVFDKWGVRHTGLFTFAQSAKHVVRSTKGMSAMPPIARKTPTSPTASCHLKRGSMPKVLTSGNSSSDGTRSRLGIAAKANSLPH